MGEIEQEKIDDTSGEQTDPSQSISPTAGSMPSLPTDDLETPRITEPHQFDPLSNLATSSVNTVEINANLAMSANSRECSLANILTEHFEEQSSSLMMGLPNFNAAKKPLGPSPVGEELEKQQLQRVREIQNAKRGGVRAAPQCVGPLKSEENHEAQLQQPERKLHISPSAISLALSTTLSTPADTPMTPGDTVKPPSASVKRQRALSLQETEAILMGSATSDSDELPAAKKSRMEAQQDVYGSEKAIDESSEQKKSRQTEGEEKKEDVESSDQKVATWSVRQNLGVRGPDQRWRTHQMAEDYISLASSITLPPTYLGPFGYSPETGQYPIEQVTALGYLKSPLRRPTVIEKWSPYEIVTFEAAITLHGKHFHQIQKWVKTKCTKEIIEFYYIWKKTSHYQRWKNQYEEEIESDSDDEDDVKAKGKVGACARLPVSPSRRGRR